MNDSPKKYCISSSFCFVLWLSNKEQNPVTGLLNFLCGWKMNTATLQMERVGESRGEQARPSNLQSPFLACLLYWESTIHSLLRHRDVFSQSPLFQSFVCVCVHVSCLFVFFPNGLNLKVGLFYSQLELCGGLTPIAERSARPSTDDTDSHTQVSLLAETAEANFNGTTWNAEDHSLSQPCYTVCHAKPFICLSVFWILVEVCLQKCLKKPILKFILHNLFSKLQQPQLFIVHAQ